LAAFYSQADGFITLRAILGPSVGLVGSFLFSGRRIHHFWLNSWSFRRPVGQLSILRPTDSSLLAQFLVFPSACWAAFYSQADGGIPFGLILGISVGLLESFLFSGRRRHFFWVSSRYFRRLVGELSLLRPTDSFLFGQFSLFPSAWLAAFSSQADGFITFGSILGLSVGLFCSFLLSGRRTPDISINV
jgi:hypothetical protein